MKPKKVNLFQYNTNHLFPKIAKLKIPYSENDETYIPVLISLFGAKSIEDIQNQIFVELYPILKKRGIKIVAGLGNTVLKYFGSNLKDLLSETGTSSESLTDYRKILICIDDIDRKSSELDLKEVFGFVNNLVENLSAKILLIANEDELRKEINTDDIDNYSLLREKVIGISINFNSNVSLTFDRIIESKYKAENKSYFDFLSEHKKTIVNQISLNKDNLRNLLFFLEHFKIIFKETSAYLSSESKFDSIKKDILETILNFTLPISIEYKLGKLNTSNFSEIIEIYQGFLFNLSRFLGDSNKKKEPKTYPELFKEKYLPDDNIQRKYFDSIFNYIIGKTSFKIELLSNELNLIYKFEDNTIPEREKLISKLNYWGCVDLKHSEYRSITSSILKYVDKGEFSLEQYPTVFHYVTRFNNLLGYNIENLKKRFKKGIHAGKDDYKYERNIHFRLSVDRTSEFYDDLKEIVEYCLKINKGIKEHQELKELTDIFNLFSSDFNSFLEKVEEMNNEFMFTPYFTKFDFSKTWRIIKKLDNSQIINLAFYFESRYQRNIYEKIFPEKIFLENLNKKIEDSISNKNTEKLKKVALKFLDEKIIDSIKNFPE
ncbi:hypothetical protein [Aequorivita echinoideorum]|uniref:KAP family P-loop domain-containing protein n=1 Tax=Aequorivita echinoideorum TaxID=1549647 RepID=A0ABS5S276_9FLAO|nr:hypothetical protein [Aequorivita echinoideorum]MBT0607269.1 hypothetical protein [Aequorivita echinoideorum]